MFSNLKKAFALLICSEKRKISFFLVYVTVLVFFEAFGVALVPLYINWILMDDSGAHLFSVLGFSKEFVWEIGAVIGLIVALGIYASYYVIKEILFESQSIGARISTSIFERMVFNKDSGDLSTVVNKVTMECDRFASFIITPVFFIFSRLVLAVSLIVVLLIYNYIYALSVILVVTALFYFIFKQSRKSVSESGNLITVSNTNRLHEVKSILGLKREFLLYGKIPKAVDRYGEVANIYGKNRALVEVISKQPRYVFEAVVLLGGLVISLLLTSNSEVDALGFLLMFGVIGYKLMPAIHQAQSYYTVFNGNLSCVDELSEVLKNSPSPNSSEGGFLESRCPVFSNIDSINIKSVAVLHDDRRIVYNEIGLKKGKLYGLIGPSGSGKTTFLDLISGFISEKDIEEFIVQVNGELVDYSCFKEVVQRNTAYLPQFSNVYGKSISESISLEKGKQNLDSNFTKYSWAFRVKEDSSLYLDERLSGGEKQRLNIARTLFYDRSIYLFDESLSGVDKFTREKVWTDLKTELQNKIVIVISHDEADHKRVDREIKL